MADAVRLRLLATGTQQTWPALAGAASPCSRQLGTTTRGK